MPWGRGQSSGLGQTHLGSSLSSAMDHPGTLATVSPLSPNFLTPAEWGLPPPLFQAYHKESMK